MLFRMRSQKCVVYGGGGGGDDDGNGNGDGKRLSCSRSLNFTRHIAMPGARMALFQFAYNILFVCTVVVRCDSTELTKIAHTHTKESERDLQQVKKTSARKKERKKALKKTRNEEAFCSRC